MQILQQYIVSYFLIFIFIASISGVKVYTHFCTQTQFNDNNEIQESTDCCNSNDDLLVNTSYFFDEETNSENAYCEDDDCCKTYKHHIKISSEFEINKQNKKIKPIYDFLFEELIITSNNSFFNNHIRHRKPELTKFRWGKILLLSINKLKTEPNPIFNS